MKKLVGLKYGLLGITVISTFFAYTNYIVGKSKIYELERAARLQNLTVIAVKNNDYNLACKAQNEAEDALMCLSCSFRNSFPHCEESIVEWQCCLADCFYTALVRNAGTQIRGTKEYFGTRHV